ncbi:GNAT family N-acetyltransferase [Agromyces aurantiacus]|uniref:GNAT family N-acetyltransferase n=1 Tax=Agromyces aurantiacus TaxID=165814 RepID=A0ABV9R4Y1_9MICO|nr:GNAT family N-acetyltransferase [Agromyces aurantiacus]MBM7503871.1 GNAT superfamily N-acetyltransferase [Agromyces aurantiacus]
MTGPIIRPARIADAPGIADVHWRSHQSTYVEPGRVARELVEAWTMRDRIQAWVTYAAISEGALAPPAGFHAVDLVVAVDGDRVVGWAVASAGRDADAPRDLELEGLYVLDEYHGAGVGQALLDEVLGDRPAYLWALADNPRAHAFYRRNGFALDGIEKWDDRWQVREVRMTR